MDSPIDASSDPEDGGLAKLLLPVRALVQVRAWFDAPVEASEPVLDGTLASERDAADTYRRVAKADNTRRAYRSAVRAWCARHALPPLPASGADVTAFLAGGRDRKLSPETLNCVGRRFARYLHRAAGCPVPTDDVRVSETLAGIHREAARKGQAPRKKVAATATVLRRLLAAMPVMAGARGARSSARPGSPLGHLRRRAAALGTGGDPLRPSGEDRSRHPAHVAADQGRADRHGDGPPALPYGDTEYCPMHALEAWQRAAGLTEGPVFRRVWLPPRPNTATMAGPPPQPRIGAQEPLLPGLVLLLGGTPTGIFVEIAMAKVIPSKRNDRKVAIHLGD